MPEDGLASAKPWRAAGGGRRSRGTAVSVRAAPGRRTHVAGMERYEAMAEGASQEASDPLPMKWVAVGAFAGTLVAALVAGSLMLVLLLAFGAILGAVAALLVVFVGRRLRGERGGSPEHGGQSLSLRTGPAAQRAEAGHASPSPG